MIAIASQDLPAWLAGAWTIERDIDDGRGTYRGSAHFSLAADGELRWEEDGQLRLDDYEGQAKRVLVIRTGEPWEVFFDDGRPFHPLDLSSGPCSVEHPCGPDHYRGTFEPLADDHLVVRWHVTGPTKDSTVVSHYRRAAAGG